MQLDLLLYLVIIPTLLLVAPWVLVRFVFTTEASRRAGYLQATPYLWLAAGLWVLSFFLPNIPLTPESQSTTLHTIGGVVAGILAAYALKAYKLRLARWWQPALFFFGFACGLGVLNELLELAINVSGLTYIAVHDTNWDLVANTLGAGLFAAAWYAVVWPKHRLAARSD